MRKSSAVSGGVQDTTARVSVLEAGQNPAPRRLPSFVARRSRGRHGADLHSYNAPP